VLMATRGTSDHSPNCAVPHLSLLYKKRSLALDAVGSHAPPRLNGTQITNNHLNRTQRCKEAKNTLAVPRLCQTKFCTQDLVRRSRVFAPSAAGRNHRNGGKLPFSLSAASGAMPLAGLKSVSRRLETETCGLEAASL